MILAEHLISRGVLYRADIKGAIGKRCLRSLEGEWWIDREIGGCEFRDAAPATDFANCSRIGAVMGQSIPLVFQDWANTKGAHRFF